MGKAGAFASAVLLAALSLAAAAVPIPSPRPTDQGRPPVAEEHTQPQYVRAHTDNGPKAPLYVKAECDKGCGYSEDDKGWWQKLWTDPVAGFTAVLAVFTVWLAFATRKAANAAKVAADALPALERAYIFIKQTGVDSLQSAARGQRSPAVVLQYVMNVGRTPAIVKDALCVVAICATPDDVVATPSGDHRSEWIIAPNTVGPPDAEDYYSRSFHGSLRPVTDVDDDDRYLTHDEILALRSKSKFLWAWSKIVYDDVFGKEHVTMTLHRVNPSTFAIEPHGGGKWNYRT